MSITLRIKELRKSKNITQKEFSTILKIDNSQYSKIESGKLQPTIQQLIDISSNFNVSIDWICFGELMESSSINYKELADARKEIIEYQKEEIEKLKKALNQK